MVGQGIGLKYLIPLAIEQLQKNPFAEGAYYKGDLLQMGLKIDKVYWIRNKENCSIVYHLIKNNLADLMSERMAYDQFLIAFDQTQN